MASVASLTATPSALPPGGVARIKWTWTLGGAQQITAQLVKDGTVVAETPPITVSDEAPPNVIVNGNTNQGWELRATGGTLVPVDVDEADLRV